MTFTNWLLYVAAVLVLTVTPGPSVLMCVATSVNHGTRQALIASLGSTTAIVIIMTLSALGLGAALAASESIFTALKWFGAGYLAYLGIRSFLSTATEIKVTSDVTGSSKRQLFAQGFLVGASNPKALFFFGALFPQFINPTAPQLSQFFVLGTTFIFFELFWLTLYAHSAFKATRWLQQPGRAKLFNRATGVVFVVAAGLLASSKRASAA